MKAAAGRFAPSPTGPLHLGSLVAAVGSWLFARSAGGRWLVRMEDLDTARVVAGAADEILRVLERYGLHWDGEVVAQSGRIPLYEEALERLRALGSTYECACSRAEIARAASAPVPGEESEAETEADRQTYSGICRNGLPAGRAARAVRFRVPPGSVRFTDRVVGSVEENVERTVGDFVLKRAGGPFAYQLAVVVDDGAQGVTMVVRGADLLSSTARQIVLQRALGLPGPEYAHLPLVIGPDGRKIGKREGALPLESLKAHTLRRTLLRALEILGQSPSGGSPAEILAEAVQRFDPAAVPRRPFRLSDP